MRVKLKQLMMDVIFSLCGCVLGWILVRHGLRPLGASPCTRGGRESASSNASRDPGLTIRDTSLMIGIMTSRKNLGTRASAIYSSWGRQVSGLLVFYIGRDEDLPESSSDPHKLIQDGILDILNGENPPVMTYPTLQEESRSRTTPGEVLPEESTRPEPIQVINDLPVVILRDVSDETYPPRGKCFAMIRHMFRSFGSRFQWFVRADDDVYIRYEELVRYLHSVDNSVPRYIGQPGIGIPTERGRLGLNPGNPYCMGGPGVVFSPPALRQLVPHLRECAQDTVTSHEDTELGRCVVQHVKLACTTDIQMRTLFYQDYRQNIFTGKLTPDVSSALTLHPVKEPWAMFRLHVHFQQQRLNELQGRAQLLKANISEITQMITDDSTTLLSDASRTEASNGKFTFNRQKSVRDFVARTTDLDKEVPAIQSSLQNWQEGSEYDSQQHGEISYQRFAEKSAESSEEDPKTVTADTLTTNNPVWDYAILRKPYMINPAKIHYSRIPIMNYATKTLKAFKKKYKLNDLKALRIRAKYQSYTLPHGLQHVVTATHDEGFQTFLLSSKFQPLHWREETQHTSENAATGNSDNLELSKPDLHRIQRFGDRFRKLDPRRGRMVWPRLYILLPLYGRHRTYLTFLKNLALAAEKYPATVRLRVALFPDSSREHRLSMEASRGHTLFRVTVLRMRTPFSRALALNKLAEGLTPNSVLIFIDVDLIITDGFLFRVAWTVKPGQAYFPVMFSQYSPSTVCYGVSNCTLHLSDLSSDSGFWRSFSYGMAGLTARDLTAVGAFNSNIVGWGKEDVDFFDRCLSKQIQIFRAPDLGLIHQFHDKSCDPRLPADQLRMCRTSRNALIGSDSKLTQMVLDLNI